MGDVIKPVNIAGAAIITQISLVAIMFVGALILRFRSIFVMEATFFQPRVDYSVVFTNNSIFYGLFR